MNYGVTASVLKPLEELTLPDPRIKHEWHRPHPSPLSAADIRERLEETATLHSGVPERVRTQFEVARNLMLYTYFVFEFQTQAELQAYATLEFALRERFGRPTHPNKQGKKAKPLMLKDLLQKAIDEKLIQPERFPSFERTNLLRKGAAEQRGYPFEPMSAAEWLELVQKFILGQRNHLAHGNPHLDLPFSFNQIQRCADIINALFPKPDEKANSTNG